MKNFLSQTVIACLLWVTVSHTGAQSEQPESVIKEDFVLKGDVIFVRPGKRAYGWTEPLRQRLNNYKEPSKIKTVVFVNMGNVGRWDAVGSEVWVQKWLKAANATTVVVGECENYCAAWFIGGAKRLMTKGASIDLKTPIEFESRTLQPRFPSTQFAMFERETASPSVLPYRNIFMEAFSKVGMTGSTKFTLDDVQFCKERSPDLDCKFYEGVNAHKVGLVTDSNPVEIQLPEGW
jgi:hypothetical protein